MAKIVKVADWWPQAELVIAMQPGQIILARDKISRAVFIDYEGSKTQPPTLLGYMIDDEIGAGIVERCFNDCRHRWGAKHAVPTDHLRLVRKLIHQAENEHRVIISWSQHDYKIMVDVLRPHKRDLSTLERLFRNAIFTAKKQFKNIFPKAEGQQNDLAFMMENTGYRVPEKYGKGVVGTSISQLRKQLASGLGYADLGPEGRRLWRTIIKHNVHDLKGMKHVLNTLV